MRLPRHDTPLRLPAEAPRAGLAADEALLEQVAAHRDTAPDAARAMSRPPDRHRVDHEYADRAERASGGERADKANAVGGGSAWGYQSGGPLVRFWVPASAAVVVGLGLSHRLGEVVDVERCQAGGVEVLHRRAGGGALLLDQRMLCGAVCVPLPNRHVSEDITESYRWLGDALAHSLGGRRVEVDEARADVAALKQRDDGLGKLLLASCYGGLSPHEVVIGRAKVVGIAQIRRRHAVLFQFGVLLRDQAPLADFLRAPDEATRHDLHAELSQRTAAVDLTGRSASAVAAAIADAMPFGQ